MSLQQIAPDEPIHQAGKFQQVRYAEKRPLPAQNEFGIRRNNIRPLRPNRADCPIAGLQQQRHPVAVIPFAHAG